MLIVELRELAAMLRDVGVRPDLAKFALERAKMAEDEEENYPVPELTIEHIEEAMKFARR